MDAQEALELVDRLVYTHSGKHLSDLERAVFLGSWQGLTYEEIYPTNPEYVEKYVGYKLWQKLSTVCSEKVTKKQFRGALERTLQRQDAPSHSEELMPNGSSMQAKRVFISHRHQEPDLSLAKHFAGAIVAAGHQAFMADSATSSQLSQGWLTQIDANLQQCDYFLLLLSPQAAVSEMVIEELQRTKLLTDARQNDQPVVLPIRVNCLPDLLLNHDLYNYLQGIPQREWNDQTDTPVLVEALLNCLNDSGEWEEEEKNKGLRMKD